jgi:broad specificity phosphatase PhoE
MSENLNINYQDKYMKYKQKYLEKINETSELIGGGKDKEIYLIRHGETDWNVQNYCQGSRNDIPLNKIGKEQSRKTGIYLNKYRQKDNKFDLVLCSPMIRAKETCKIICKKINYNLDKIVYMDELKENDKGLVCIGKSNEELKKDKFYDDYFMLFDKINKIEDPIEKESSYKILIKDIEDKYEIESLITLIKRMNKVINYIKKTNKKKILIISHSGYIISILKYIFNVNKLNLYFKETSNCHISYLKYTNKFELLYGPSTSHFNLFNK